MGCPINAGEEAGDPGELRLGVVEAGDDERHHLDPEAALLEPTIVSRTVARTPPSAR